MPAARTPFCSLSLDGEVFPCPWFVSDDGLDQAINQKQTSGILSGFVFEGCRVIIDIPGHKLSFVRDTTAESAAREKLLRLGLIPVNTSEGLWARLGAETVKNAGMDRQDIVTQINHASLDHILDLKLLNTATTSLVLTVMRSNGGVIGPKDVTVPLASLQKSALSSVPAGETFPLIPNEPVIYYFPYGATLCACRLQRRLGSNRHRRSAPYSDERLPLTQNGVHCTQRVMQEYNKMSK